MISITKQLVYFYNFMQNIEQELKVKCIKGNDGVNVCVKAECKNAAIMCQVNDCDCCKTHENCFFTNRLNKVKQGFEKKGRCIIPILK